MSELQTKESRDSRRALTLMTVVLIFGMSTWFSATAIIPQLSKVWDLTATTKAWLTISVQLGFVAGALLSATLNLADRYHPRIIIFLGGMGAAVANILLVIADGPQLGIAFRFITGFFMAGVYPPAFKLISTWFLHKRGVALGILVGAIIAGNAMPHLVNGFGGVDWRNVIYVTSLLSALGGIVALAVREGPYPFVRAKFDPRQIGAVFSNRGVRLATFGYFGHMWELVAMYAWFLVFFSDHLGAKGATPLPLAAFVTFAVMALGFPGSWVAGLISDRWGRTSVAMVMLAISGLCAIAIGFFFSAPTWVVVLIGLVWGFSIVADSAQFSVMVTELGDQAYIGTALTTQLALGFTISITTIWLIPFVENLVGWRWTFAILAFGPFAGIAAMLRLRSLPESSRLAGGLG